MKRKRIILIVFGWLCIFFNAVGWLAVIAVPDDKYEAKGIPEMIGFNFWFVIGFILLLNARKVKRKIERIKEQEILNDLLAEKEQYGGKF